MILLLFGPPGCGKGTQAVYVADKFRIPAISTGEMFRSECKAGTELGKIACSILAKGGLVGDDIVNAMVANRIAAPDCANGFLLDGYPRTVQQAMYLGAVLKTRGLPEPVVIHLDVPDDVLVGRLTARRQCPQCKRIYNLLFQPPRTAGLCDDQEAVIRKRLSAYAEVTGPILQWYGKAVVRTIEGAAPPDQVARAIERVVLEAEPEPAPVK
jgi:adenylate kinase